LKKYTDIKDSEEIFEVTEQYEVKKILGNGAYGVVALAYDNVNNKNVAIKKVLKTFKQGFFLFLK
jgi:serine/threonine protein kinase